MIVDNGGMSLWIVQTMALMAYKMVNQITMCTCGVNKVTESVKGTVFIAALNLIHAVRIFFTYAQRVLRYHVQYKYDGFLRF